MTILSDENQQQCLAIQRTAPTSVPYATATSERIVMTTPRGSRVAGKRVLVTGAARGMGRSHAVRLAEEGADIVIVDICAPIAGLEYELASEDDLAQTADAVESAEARCISVVADIRDENALTDAVNDAAASLEASTLQWPTQAYSLSRRGTAPPRISGEQY